MSKKIVYIIPLHKKDDRVFDALDSIPAEAEVVIAIPEELQKWMSKELTKSGLRSDGVFTAVSNRGSSYPILVNMGLDVVLGGDIQDVDFVSILEFDDKLMPNAHKIVNEYAEDWEDAEVLAPLACVVKEIETDDKPLLVGIANEAPMAPQIAEEFGYFDFNMMLRTNFIFVNGCYIKPSVFEDYGRFKENFEIFYDYEWALRAVYNGCVIRTIPKATHFHTMSDDGAFETQKALPKEDRENWLGAARREYFFEDDREINFD